MADWLEAHPNPPSAQLTLTTKATKGRKGAKKPSVAFAPFGPSWFKAVNQESLEKDEERERRKTSKVFVQRTFEVWKQNHPTSMGRAISTLTTDYLTCSSNR